RGENSEKQEIQKIRADVDKLSDELKSAVSELKKSIVDIRSAVSEIENPFNLLRAISSEKDVKKLNGARLPPGVKSLIIGKPEEVEEAEETVVEEARPPEPETEPREAVQPVAEAPPPPRASQQQHEAVPTRTTYLNWVWALLDAGFSSEEVGLLADSYEQLGFLPRGVSGQIHALAIAAEKARAKGLTLEELMLNMYEASAISGITLGMEDFKNIISIAGRKAKHKQA
ncbi:hypothetical protein H5T51_04565, partial [Candidatus Bathyarchaeota archaeon]|nr:hypothetical protein [Candidatus Bathyarchaeota archaeon]